MLLHYDLHGAAEAPRGQVLLIMGLLTDGAAWAFQSEFLARQGFQCVTYDNRGVARSGSPGLLQLPSYSTQRMARDAWELTHHLGWSRFHVVGVSMGGMISMELALLVPERLRSLTLVVTHAGGFGGIAPFSGVAHMLVSLFSRQENSRLQALMRMLYSKATLEDPKLSKTLEGYHLKRMATRIPPKLPAILGHTLAVYRHYVSYPRLLRIRYSPFPTLVMVGEVDQLVRISNSRMLSRVLGARLCVVPNGGHGMMAEYPDFINEQLLGFFTHTEDTAALDAERLLRDRLGDNNTADGDAETTDADAGGDESEYESATQQLVAESDVATGESSYTLEQQALDLACSHNVHCFLHNVSGFVTGFVPAFLFRWAFFDSIALNSASAPVSRWDQSVRFGLVVGVVRGALRAIKCIVHAWKARAWIIRHGLHAPPRNNMPDGSSSSSSAATAAALRKGIPSHAGFDFPYHSLALLMGFLAIVWKKALWQDFLPAE